MYYEAHFPIAPRDVINHVRSGGLSITEGQDLGWNSRCAIDTKQLLQLAPSTAERPKEREHAALPKAGTG